MKDEGKISEETQFKKTPNTQAEFNRETKNEDALYKFLAYSGMLEKKRREDLNKTRKDDEVTMGMMNFTEFYKEQLQLDAKKEPRPVKAEDYMPRRDKVEASKAGEGFKTLKEREQQYYKDFETYKENKSKSFINTQP